MASNGLSAVLTAAAALILLWSSWSDLAKREIPNCAVVLLALGGIAQALFGGNPHEINWMGALLILLIGFPLSSFLGLIGAGDVKLLAAAALWTPGRTVDLLLLTALLGGVLAVIYLILNIVRTKKTNELPYGVAVSLALLLMLVELV